MNDNFIFTSESVTAGHPDRLCDTISDAVVDGFLREDPYSRIITECALSKGLVFLAARFASTATIDIPEIARSVIKDSGYHGEAFNAVDCTVVTSLTEQPLAKRSQKDEAELSDSEINRIVTANQVTQFGFACTHTEECMPLPIYLANQLARKIDTTQRLQQLPYLSPDGSTQVAIEFRDGHPIRLHSITLVACCEDPEWPGLEQMKADLQQSVIEPVFVKETLKPDANTLLFINPSEIFLNKSGPAVHSGMTGRKTASDAYGGYARHSGSALSGKDPLRIDRVAAYAARYAAKNVVAAGLAEECEVQLSYIIGQCRPVSIRVTTHGSKRMVDDTLLTKRVSEVFDFRLGAIIRDFNLRHLPALDKLGFYKNLPAHGHFGHSLQKLPWEKTDKADQLRDLYS